VDTKGRVASLVGAPTSLHHCCTFLLFFSTVRYFEGLCRPSPQLNLGDCVYRRVRTHVVRGHRSQAKRLAVSFLIHAEAVRNTKREVGLISWLGSGVLLGRYQMARDSLCLQEDWFSIVSVRRMRTRLPTAVVAAMVQPVPTTCLSGFWYSGIVFSLLLLALHDAWHHAKGCGWVPIPQRKKKSDVYLHCVVVSQNLRGGGLVNPGQFI